MSQLRLELRALQLMGDAHGGDDVRPLAVRLLARIRRVIETSGYPDSIGLQLRRLAGEAASRCAYVHFDACDHQVARQYWGEALTIGTTLDDDQIKSQALAMLALQANYIDQPRHALDFLAAAQRHARSLKSPVLDSIIASREAEAYGIMGDHAMARARLAHAMRLMDGPLQNRPGWTSFYDRAELESYQATIYASAGNHKAAASYNRASIAHVGASYGRNRAVRQFILANNLAQAGEADEAAATAIAGLEQLSEVSSGRVRVRTIAVRDTLSSIDSRSTREATEALDRHLT